MTRPDANPIRDGLMAMGMAVVILVVIALLSKIIERLK
jgi:hypothetical protein